MSSCLQLRWREPRVVFHQSWSLNRHPVTPSIPREAPPFIHTSKSLKSCIVLSALTHNDQAIRGLVRTSETWHVFFISLRSVKRGPPCNAWIRTHDNFLVESLSAQFSSPIPLIIVCLDVTSTPCCKVLPSNCCGRNYLQFVLTRWGGWGSRCAKVVV